MNIDILTYALLGSLAITLLITVYTDLKYRLIFNNVTITIGLLAPIYWYATNDYSLPAIGAHLLTAAIVFAIFLLFFQLKLVGGGDVKLFTALALWFSWVDVTRMMLVTAIAGGAITLIYVITYKMLRKKMAPRIPYGVAIAIGGLWIVCELLFNHYM